MLNDFEEFWGEPISIYTDADALGDGVIIDISDWQIYFNGRIINRATLAAKTILELSAGGKDSTLLKNRLSFIARHSIRDREGTDAWGIFEPDARFGAERLWLVGNETRGYTIMLPSDY